MIEKKLIFLNRALQLFPSTYFEELLDLLVQVNGARFNDAFHKSFEHQRSWFDALTKALILNSGLVVTKKE